jgi:hypothetical protein
MDTLIIAGITVLVIFVIIILICMATLLVDMVLDEVFGFSIEDLLTWRRNRHDVNS